ncbi:MAG: alpha/beta hydrolase [Arcicella sp.]|nr:alpha/beta hydrolase [Arcicella sp.]
MNVKNFIVSFCSLSLISITSMGQNTLTFDPTKFIVQSQEFQGKTVKVRAFEKVVYVANPADIVHEVMNVYIPEEYFNGEIINGYTAQTAPIFFPNKVGGYMPAQPDIFISNPQQGRDMGGPPSLSIVMALSKGYVVASAGARGRISPIGKAPAGIVDLKAAVRYLKFNDKLMAGDANKIISNGTSAGGAMSTLLGATGNHPDYEPYLKAVGAANATDDIFAVSAYCPIINLENADMAYEWQFNKIHTYKGRGGEGTLNEIAIKVSDELKKAFPQYVNGLNLKDKQGKKIILNENGEGNFKELVMSYIIASAQKALDAGIDLSTHSFLKIENKRVLSLDFDAYLTYMERMKTPPAFDALDNSSPENQLFGTASRDKRHFTNYAMQKTSSDASMMADKLQVKMMNPMNYIGDKSAKISTYWRIRHGAKDRDTGFAVPVILATTLQNKGFKTDFALPWDVPHSGDYDLEELFIWIKELK